MSRNDWTSVRIRWNLPHSRCTAKRATHTCVGLIFACILDINGTKSHALLVLNVCFNILIVDLADNLFRPSFVSRVEN